MEISLDNLKSLINLERTPENLYNLGIANKQAGHILEAIRYFSEAISIEINFVNAYIKRADCYEKIKNFKYAYEDYRFLFYNKNSVSYAIACSEMLRLQNQFDEAIAWANNAVSLDKNNYEIYVVRGMTHFDKGNFPIAFIDFSLGLLLSPENIYLYIQVGNTLGQMEMHSEAIVCFTKGLERAKTNEDKGMLLYNRAVSKSQVSENYKSDFCLSAELNFEPAKSILRQMDSNK